MSGGGGGIIIIRSSIVGTLDNPLVGGNLPVNLRRKADHLCAKPVDHWSEDDDHMALFLFNYVATHC